MTYRERSSNYPALAWPYSPEAEKAILGAILLDEKSLEKVKAELAVEDFCDPNHRRIYSKMLDLVRRGIPVELPLLYEELKSHASIDGISGSYLAELSQAIPTASSVLHYVDLVRQNANRRKQLLLLQHTAEVIGEDRGDEEEQQAIQALTEALSPSTNNGGRQPIISAMDFCLQQGKEPISPIVPDLLYRQGITVVAGAAGSLKSMFILALCSAVAQGNVFLGRVTRQSPVVYINRDDPPNLISARLSKMGLPKEFSVWTLAQNPEPPMLGSLEYGRLIQGLNRPVLIFDALVDFHQAKENVAEEMGKVMGNLRQLTKTGASILVLHHRGKDEENAYRGSSAIAAGVDVLVKLVRENSESEVQELLLQVEKNRFDPEKRITIEARREENCWSFEDATAKRQEEELSRLQDVIRGLNKTDEAPNQSQVVQAASEQLGWAKGKVLGLLPKGKGTWWQEGVGQRNRRLYRPIEEPKESDPA